MIISPSTWKAFLENHESSEENNKAFPFISEAFEKEKSVAECTNAALGVTPGIFLAFPIEAQKPVLIHHLNRAFRNPAICNDTDELFGLISWDDRPLATKLDPSNLFVLAGDGTIDEQGNLRNHFKNVDTNCLFEARNAREFSEVPDVGQNEKMFLRCCIPVPPFIALMMIDHIEDEDAHQLGARLASGIRFIAHDVDHDLHEIVTSDEGKKALETILAWLLKAHTCFDLRIMSNQVFAGSKIDKLAKAIKLEKLSSPRITSNDPTNNNNTADRDLLLQSNVAIIQELIENWRTIQENNGTGASEKGFQKLSSGTQAFLLAIGSKDLETSRKSITHTGLELLKMTQKHAADELGRRLRKETKKEINIEMANMMEIITIKWFASHNPFIGLSLCRLSPASKYSAASAFEKVEKLEL
jgi:hypothetical protein